MSTLLEAQPTGDTTLVDTPQATTPAQQSFSPESFIGEGGKFKEDTDWQAALAPLGLQEQAGQFSKYKSLGDFLKGHTHVVQMATGKSKGLVPPSGPDDEAGIAAWREGLGIPDSPDGYKIKTPESLPEGVTFDQEAAKPYIDLAHKHNIPPAFVQELVNLNLQIEGQRAQTMSNDGQLAQAQALESESKKLQDEHGTLLPNILDHATRAAAAIGLDPKTNPLFATADNVNAFAKLANLIGEDKLPNNLQSAQKADKEAALDIIKNPDNPKYKLYHAGDDATNKLVQAGLSSM